MKHQRQNSIARLAMRAVLPMVCLLMLSNAARAQVDQPGPPPLPVDPTPLVDLISAVEKQSIDAARGPKKVAEAYLAIADAHLEAAYAAIKTDDYRTAERELDIYKKALAEVTELALAQQQGKRAMSKKVEQRIYKQLKTLEMVERLFPFERVAFAQDAVKQAKQFRVQALHSSLDTDDVLHEPDEENDEKKEPIKSDPPKKSETSFFSASRAAAQVIAGDYLTEEEDDHVRQAQRPDERMKVFMKIADRRIAALQGEKPIDPTDKKAKEKADQEVREWGALPKLSREQLLRHYARAISESIAKLEDAHERNPKDSAIPRALSVLRDSTDRHLPALRALTSQVKGDREAEAMSAAIAEAENANQGAKEGLKGK
ncbi:MAG TPA: hypothetical protein VID27_22100 [Blastocatellia bacterium]